ncbi:hypothetical protein DEO72_LG10g614 [Vigna unguiculata]|uniref:Uncharacterized protein n=1 Tax=Vigna unguiculata TaxID=3917 RepID=A0A4D6NB87_VIGUN|nr:hypothetical protein DEO72_LG10g614 [Vigna unguiculata]
MTKSNNQTRSRVVKGKVGTSNTRKMMKVVGALEKEKLNIAHMEAELANVREKRKVISARLKKMGLKNPERKDEDEESLKL